MIEIKVNKAKNEQLLNDVKELRYKVIEFAITIENIISEILIDFIGTEKTKNILEKHLFSDVITFEKKICLFNALNKKNLIPKTKKVNEISSSIGYIKNLRNFMAHCSIHAPDGFIDNYRGEFLEFTSFTQKDEQVIVKVYKKKVAENEKDKIYSSESFYEKCKLVIEGLVDIHNQILNLK
jgi:hypothetical protein